jgi:hypothetical protein
LSNKVKELNNQFRVEGIDKEFLFGASINPNRKDWESEMNYVLTQTDVVLFKLIPSAQNVRLNDSKHNDFYKELAKNNIPLLCHVGPEYCFPGAFDRKSLDNFRNLTKPLESDVTIIAAHCATPVFPLMDKNEVTEFSKFMQEANKGKIRLYGDISGFSITSRLPIIPQIRDNFDPHWLVQGSDFPVPIDGWSQLPVINPQISPKEYFEIISCDNPFDQDVLIKKAHGFEEVTMEFACQIIQY